jgi:hypothetical protein
VRVYNNGIWRYTPAGKDVWGQPVWAAYFLGEFAGYRYRRTKGEIKKLEKMYGKGAVRVWLDCPEWCLQATET